MTKDITSGSNLFAYCNNEPINKSDPTGQLAGLLTSTAILAILVAALATIGIYWAASKIIRSIDYSFIYRIINNMRIHFRLTAGVIGALIIGTIKSAYKYVRRYIRTQAKAISAAISIATADAQIRITIKRDKKHSYWEAYWYNNIVFIGKGISRARAISRVKSRLSIFAKRKQLARTVAWEAGKRKTPYGPHTHCNGIKGYYWHYHVYKQHYNKYSAHVYYL